jgi:hypothetical protein
VSVFSNAESACCFEEHELGRPTTEAPGEPGPLATPKRGG